MVSTRPRITPATAAAPMMMVAAGPVLSSGATALLRIWNDGSGAPSRLCSWLI